jgi:hypothetical protein
VDISNSPEESKKDTHSTTNFNHPEVLAVATWHRHLREWKVRQNQAEEEASWKDVPKMEDGTDVGVKLAIVKGARSNFKYYSKMNIKYAIQDTIASRY